MAEVKKIATRDSYGKALVELGAIDDHTRCFLNHFSHNGGLLYDDLTAKAAPLDLEVSYDGMEIDL